MDGLEITTGPLWHGECTPTEAMKTVPLHRPVLFTTLLAVAACTTQSDDPLLDELLDEEFELRVGTQCYDLSNPPAGTTYASGDWKYGVFADIQFMNFQFSNGDWTSGGAATYSATNLAGGTPPQELSVSNIDVRVIPDVPASTEATYLYADFGGNVNFGVNGDFRNTADLADLDGTVVGGCEVSVTEIPVFGGVIGQVTITAGPGIDIEKFGFGGQEFWVDDICFE